MRRLHSPLPFITLLIVFSVSKTIAQGVAVNTTGAAPNTAAILHVDLGTDQEKGFLITGVSTPSANFPNLGGGSRLMFYPGKGAFRAGRVTESHWDNVNVGQYSVALGYNTKASGQTSTALGTVSTASGENSVAIGYFPIASGDRSVALGLSTKAEGSGSTAMGISTLAKGTYSTAMGNGTCACGLNSTALGYNTIALGQFSTAMGGSTSAAGEYSTAMGYLTFADGKHSTAIGYNTSASGLLSLAAGTNVSTNNKTGSFFFGDSDPNQKGVRAIGFTNQFAARFNGGYYFISSDAGADIGVQVLAGGNAWVAKCDENRKENFEPLDGEEILEKMKEMNFFSWNYKTQDPAENRHYGIMAQDFSKAFGTDKYGKIGNDTTVNPIDMIGIDMAAIQALEKRTAQLAGENLLLRNEMIELRRRLDKMESAK